MSQPTLIPCKQCRIPLHPDLFRVDPYLLKTQLTTSRHLLRGDGYALNAFRDLGKPTCPICGFQVEGAEFTGSPPYDLGRRLTCDIECSESELEFLKRHARVHLRSDLGMARGHVPSKEYAFAHLALRHFVIGGTVSAFNHAIGAIALANPKTSNAAFQYLCEIVRDATGQSLSRDQFEVSAFETKGSACVVVKMPPPNEVAEAYFVGIVTNASLEKAENTSGETDVLYFTLEMAEEQFNFPRTILGEWKYNDRRNYGYGPNANVEDFVECVETVWLSKIWQ